MMHFSPGASVIVPVTHAGDIAPAGAAPVGAGDELLGAGAIVTPDVARADAREASGVRGTLDRPALFAGDEPLGGVVTTLLLAQPTSPTAENATTAIQPPDRGLSGLRTSRTGGRRLRTDMKVPLASPPRRDAQGPARPYHADTAIPGRPSSRVQRSAPTPRRVAARQF